MELLSGRTDAAIVSRRKLILSSLAGGAALMGGGAVAISAQRPVRFVHLTDAHLWDERGAREGFAKAMEKLASLTPAVDFVITGGDHVMESFDVEPAKAKRQWDVWDQSIDPIRTRMSIYPVIGNHDVLAWEPRDGASHYGKSLALERLGMGTSYYSFDRAGWHFICLDNIARSGKSYTGGIDPAQKEWLKEDLRRTGHERPICVVSHIPILSACVFFDPASIAKDGTNRVECSDMQADYRDMLEILRPEARPYNVKLAISGHIHLHDRVEYEGITFICGGAVSGNWWRGDWGGYRCGLGVYDLHDDGRFEYRYERV